MSVISKDTDCQSFIYLFGEGPSETRNEQVRGCKGNGLSRMVLLDMPVPPGATITTAVARFYRESGKFPVAMARQIRQALRVIEQKSGLLFGSSTRPLLLSVRSGAAVSMPGMMDTILNVGLNPLTCAGLALLLGEHAAWDCYRRFIESFAVNVMKVPRNLLQPALSGEKHNLATGALKDLCSTLLAIIEGHCRRPLPDDPLEQLQMAIAAVLDSWMSERACAFRLCRGIDDTLGTAVNIQTMVFGNCDKRSGTGVVFSADPVTGEDGLYGEYLVCAQGEDLVSGTSTPQSIVALAAQAPELYDQLSSLVGGLAGHYDDLLEVEFTVQSGRLYLLQCRSAKRTGRAAAVFAVRQVESGRWSRDQALKSIKIPEIEKLRRPRFDEKALAVVSAISDRLLLQGRAACPGAVTAELVISEKRAMALHLANKPFILARLDTVPHDLPLLLTASGIVTANGGATCHAAVVARGQDIPAAVGCDFILDRRDNCHALWAGHKWIKEGETVSLDGDSGRLLEGSVLLSENKTCREVGIFLAWLDERGRQGLAEPVDLVWRQGRYCLNRWLNDFYLSASMHRSAEGSRLEEQARLLKDQVEADLAALFSCYLLCSVAHEILFFCFREPAKASTNAAFCQLQERFAVQIALHGDYSTLTEKIVQAVSNADLAGQTLFFELCSRAFATTDCWDEGFGRQAWADIAGAAAAYLGGKIKRSVYVDHVFDLRHHGNAMFNNHVMVSYYTREPLLNRQLTVKKDAITTGALYSRLTELHACHSSIDFLFKRGVECGLWS